MADIAHRPSQLDVEGFEILEVLDPHRNAVLRVHASAEPADALVVKLLKPEFEPILPGRRRAGSRRLLRVVKRSRGWVSLLGTGTSTSGLDYIVQPYYPNGSLLDALGRGGRWRSLLSLVGDAAAVVGQLSAHGLALGCLRPSYLLIADDAVVVSLFGMSTRRFDDGTTQYPAPEQLSGSEPTPVSDVYTLGLILAELLADRQRLPDEPVHDLITSLPDSIPSEVIDLLDHATTSRVKNRIANAALLHRAITRLLADLPDDGAQILVRESPQSGLPGTDPVTSSPSTSPPQRPLNGFAAQAGSQGATQPDPGPLADLLQPEWARPTIRHYRPTPSPRSAVEIELETMVETLSGLPAATDHGSDTDAHRGDPESDDDPKGQHGGNTGRLGGWHRIGGGRPQ